MIHGSGGNMSTDKVSLMSLELRNKCNCECHTNPNVLCGFDACCQGECEGCHQGFYDLKNHRKICPEWIVWACKQKRAELRRLELYEEFRSILSEGDYNDESV